MKGGDPRGGAGLGGAGGHHTLTEEAADGGHSLEERLREAGPQAQRPAAGQPQEDGPVLGPEEEAGVGQEPVLVQRPVRLQQPLPLLLPPEAVVRPVLLAVCGGEQAVSTRLEAWHSGPEAACPPRPARAQGGQAGSAGVPDQGRGRGASSWLTLLVRPAASVTTSLPGSPLPRQCPHGRHSTRGFPGPRSRLSVPV